MSMIAKKTTIFLFTILLLLVFFSGQIINAQDNVNRISLSDSEIEDLQENDKPAVITDVQSLRADFVQNVQDPGSKVVKFEMVLRSNIESDRVRITWNIRGDSSLEDESQLQRTIAVQPGGVYSIPIEIKPFPNGVTEVFGTAQAFLADSNIVVTVRKNFASNANREILPITDDYKSAQRTNFAMNIGITTVVLLVLAVLGLIGFKEFGRWYKDN